MAGIKDIAKGRSDLYKVAITDLHVKEGWNSRDYDAPDNQEHIQTLAHSIASEGVKEPLTGWMEDGKIFVENGHMRRLAVIWGHENIEGFPTDMLVPIQISPKEASDVDRLLSQITRNSGKTLSPLEMANLFEKLKAADSELTDADIARRCGISRVYVGQLLNLSKQPKSVTKFVRSGEVSPTLAIEVVNKAKGNSKKAAELLKLAVDAAKAVGKTRATPKHVRSATGEDVGTVRKAKDEAPKKSEPKPADEPRKSQFKVMQEVRTIVEQASVERDSETDEVLIVLSDEKWQELSKLLDLEVKPKGEEVETADDDTGI